MTDNITTTLAKIREHSPCKDGWKKLYKSLGGIKAYGENTPIKFSQIVESNGLEDAIWCLRTICPDHAREVSLFAADCADNVLHIFEKQHPDDDRPRKAIQATRDFAEGRTKQQDLDFAKSAARDAARDARTTAWDADAAAWEDAWSAVSAAKAASWDDACCAAEDARDVDPAREQQAQKEMLIERFG